MSDGLDLLHIGAEIPIIGVIATLIGAVVVIALLVIWFPPLIAIAWEIVLFAVLCVGGVFARFVLRRPWWIEAASRTERRHWYVHGYRAAGRRRDELASRFAHGQNPTGDEMQAMTN